jgi:hypothetical protein
MFRHTAFFIFKPEITPEQHLAMLKGLAYMRFECASVLALDFGTDLFGGSERLRRTKPWDRTPRWRAASEGPPSNYDVALMLDFADAAGNEAYNNDDVHHEVGEYNASICRAELTARVDWEYEGEPLTRHGHVRHSCMFLWADDADESAREEAHEQVRRLGSAPGVESLTIGRNVGKLATDFDWILDVQVPDQAAAEALLESDLYGQVLGAVAPATKYEWTARLTHRMRGI